MTILVTGGCGYIGSKLIGELPKTFPKETIRIFDSMLREKYCSLWNLPKDSTAYEMIDGDIRNENDVKRALRDVSIVFHLADITNASASFRQKKLTKEVNYGGVLNLLKHIDENISCFVYTSSASVYGETKGVADETAKCSPMSPYAESKFLAEKAVLAKSSKENFPSVCLRFGTAVGWSTGMRIETVVDRFAYLACLNQPVTIWKSSVDIVRPFVNINDMVRAYLFTVKHKNKMNGQVFNAASENLNMSEIIELMKRNFENFKFNASCKSDPNKASYAISSNKIKSLGFDFKNTVEDGIIEIKEKFKNITPNANHVIKQLNFQNKLKNEKN